MPNLSQLDATTAIALVALVVSLFSLFLTIRRDRAAGRVRVRMVVSLDRDVYYGDDAAELRVSLSNPERRAVTVQSAGLTMDRRARREPYPGWDCYGQSRKCLPQMFEPGDPAGLITMRLARARAACWPEVARWVWCEDANGRPFWARIPESVRAAIAATRPRKRIVLPINDYGHTETTLVEVPEGETVERSELDDGSPY